LLNTLAFLLGLGKKSVIPAANLGPYPVEQLGNLGWVLEANLSQLTSDLGAHQRNEAFGALLALGEEVIQPVLSIPTLALPSTNQFPQNFLCSSPTDLCGQLCRLSVAGNPRNIFFTHFFIISHFDTSSKPSLAIVSTSC
jgi:hypothetical protein